MWQKIYIVFVQSLGSVNRKQRKWLRSRHTQPPSIAGGGWDHDFEQTDRSSNETDRAGKNFMDILTVYKLTRAVAPVSSPLAVFC